MDVKVQIFADKYPKEISWDVTYGDTGIVVMQKKLFKDGLTFYEKSKCLDRTATCGGTDYTFTIYDSEGDGLCCGKSGDGLYRVLVEDKVVACGGSDFTYEKSISLCGVL